MASGGQKYPYPSKEEIKEKTKITKRSLRAKMVGRTYAENI